MPHKPARRPRTGGPRTPEGKARSAQNARKHGLCSQWLALTVEDRGQLDELARSFTAEHQPVGPAEEHLVDEMVAAAWREERCQSLECAALDIRMHRDQDEVASEFEIMDGASRAALAVERLSPDGALLVNYARYETAFHRIFHRALNQLLALQDRRRRQSPPIPNPVPVPQLAPKLRNEQPAAPGLDQPSRPPGAEPRSAVRRCPNDGRWYPGNSPWKSIKSMSPSGSSRIGQSGGSTRASFSAERQRTGGPYFSLVIPPPNVTGLLHMGHMFEHSDIDVADPLAPHARRATRCGCRAPITPASPRR